VNRRISPRDAVAGVSQCEIIFSRPRGFSSADPSVRHYLGQLGRHRRQPVYFPLHGVAFDLPAGKLLPEQLVGQTVQLIENTGDNVVFTRTRPDLRRASLAHFHPRGGLKIRRHRRLEG